MPAELGTIASRVEASRPGVTDAEDWRIQFEPLHEVFTSDYAETLYLRRPPLLQVPIRPPAPIHKLRDVRNPL